MKTQKKKAEKSTVELMRDIREKVSTDIQDMSFEQLKKYIDERLSLHPKSSWRKAS